MNESTLCTPLELTESVARDDISSWLLRAATQSGQRRCSGGQDRLVVGIGFSAGLDPRERRRLMDDRGVSFLGVNGGCGTAILQSFLVVGLSGTLFTGGRVGTLERDGREYSFELPLAPFLAACFASLESTRLTRLRGTITPCLSGHLKYRFPSRIPSCSPTGSSNLMPTKRSEEM